MSRKHHRRNTANAKRAKAAAAVPPQSKPKVGLLVTDELQTAFNQCRATVERIAKDCRTKNRRFRDVEFDLDKDPALCLFGLVPEYDCEPTGVARVPDIFSKPRFFIDGAGSNDIMQGGLGDCWFLSALSTASLALSLIEKFCVARDEEVGVYGFVFFKNGSWVNVIIDDLLFINVPKFEELSSAEQALFHNDKRKYNRMARKGGKNLYFARSGTENETWVPLIEKAYAKLHGDYSSLSAGLPAEGLEDVTGGVSSTIQIKDILDTGKFWEEELLKANVDRLFSAAYDELDSTRSGKPTIEVEGLHGGHAYSVLKAVEVAGKRFVVLRNPWGYSEWKGPWSDGSKEWTTEWLRRLPEIGHVFGEDGQFIMEYSDFLEQFGDIDKTILFDESWKMSMEWLRVPTRPPPAAWSFGDVSFNFSIVGPTRAVIVLSRLDDRYFKGIEGCYLWNLQFLVYRVGDEDVTLVAESQQSVDGCRSVSTEANLEPGNYAVHVRMDGVFKGEQPDPKTFDKRKLARVLTERSQARVAASNYDPLTEKANFPIPTDVLVEREKHIASNRADPSAVVVSSEPIVDDAPKDASSGNEKKAEKVKRKGKERKKAVEQAVEPDVEKEEELVTDSERSDTTSSRNSSSESESGEDNEDSDKSLVDSDGEIGNSPGDPLNGPESTDAFIGLRVYTQGGEQATIRGTIKNEADEFLTSVVYGAVAPEDSGTQSNV